MADVTDLRNAGLKSTLPRLKILTLLESTANKHLTAEDIYKKLIDAEEDIGLATVYRVLTQFESAGLVEKHNFEGGRSVFELKREGHHDHMVCVECGRVFEFYDKSLENRQSKIAANAGFDIHDHAMYLYGVCEGMRKKGKCSKPENNKQ